MATELKGLIQISQDGQFVWFTDKTGEFDVTSNDTGWGDPNFELNQSAILVFVYRMQNPKVLLKVVGSTVKHSAAAVNTDELVFQYDYLQDGYHQFNEVRLMVSADDATSIDTVPIVFTEGMYWYNSVTAEVKQLVSGQAVVQDLTDTDVLDAIFTNQISVIVLLCEKNFYKNLAVEKNNKYTNYRNARRDNNVEQRNRMRTDGMDIILGVSTSDYQFLFGFKSQSHDTVDSLLDDFELS